MKYILSFFLTFSVLCTSLSAVEYSLIKVAASTGEVNVATLELYNGDVCELLLISNYQGNTDVSYTTLLGDDLVEYIILTKGGSGSSTQNCSTVLVGPATLKLSIANGSHPSSESIFHATLHYKLTRASEVEYKNVNIVALPSSTVGQGTHEIVVEASDDLQTWTAVHSSSIGGSKAFFRTRVVEAGN